ncbi:MAG TPA: M12 family metallopeptidase [Chitinophagaceae bacterium]|nr:M12 family metallopeptidase [Chitinophagaceae bacterium]
MKRILIVLIVLAAAWNRSDAQVLPKTGCTSDLGEAMFGEVDTTKPRGVGDNYHTWENGTVLLVKFMPGGSQMMREKVIQNAKEWEKYANITFMFVPDTTSTTDIRIKLGRGLGHNSAVGTEARFRPQSKQTVNFDTLFFADQEYYLQSLKNKGILPPYNWNHLINEMRVDPDHWNLKELRRVVMHEFGHVLGLLHEQSYPGAVNWKKTDSVYDYYRQTQGWDRAKVDFNVFSVASQFYTNGTQYDPKSIMHYAIESWQTIDGYAQNDNFELSDGDKKLIAALYPKDKKEAEKVVPKVDVTGFGDLKVVNDKFRKGLVIKPSFNLKTNSKLGEVYLVAQLADEDGYWIKTSGLYYNWGGVTATYIKLKLLPNTKVSYNKGGRNNIPVELFLPYDQIPSLYGRKIKVVFSVYLDDVVNNQRDKLMYFSMTNPLSITTQ